MSPTVSLGIPVDETGLRDRRYKRRLYQWVIAFMDALPARDNRPRLRIPSYTRRSLLWSFTGEGAAQCEPALRDEDLTDLKKEDIWAEQEERVCTVIETQYETLPEVEQHLWAEISRMVMVYIGREEVMQGNTAAS